MSLHPDPFADKSPVERAREVLAGHRWGEEGKGFPHADRLADALRDVLDEMEDKEDGG